MKNSTANTLTFIAGVIFGASGAEALDEIGDTTPAVLDCSEVGTGTGTGTESDSESGSDTADLTDTTTGIGIDPSRMQNYCETYPQYCNNPEPCPTSIDPTGRVVSGCFPAEWACCAPTLGCWAVNFPSECGNAGLYWFDCEAGEQTVDPVTGEGVLLCHD